jgi:hypothetical protein
MNRPKSEKMRVYLIYGAAILALIILTLLMLWTGVVPDI